MLKELRGVNGPVTTKAAPQEAEAFRRLILLEGNGLPERLLIPAVVTWTVALSVSSRTAGYWSVWSSISAVGAFCLTDSIPLTALALVS